MDKGGLDLKIWKLTIPGKDGTIWEGGHYTLTATFPDEYPAKPPKVRFDSGFYHPNVYPSGTICLSILNEDEDWRPALTMKQLVLGIQELLDTPNLNSPAQQAAFAEYGKDRELYNRKVKDQALRYPPPA